VLSLRVLVPTFTVGLGVLALPSYFWLAILETVALATDAATILNVTLLVPL
jgi:hypothetical protein